MKQYLRTMKFLYIFVIGMTAGHPSDYSGDSDENEVFSYNFPYRTRSEWKARTPKQTTPLNTPVPYVVIHHSYVPEACYTNDECVRAMQSMQNYHMDDHGWWDIGYTFAVGSDGVAYEGRGWKMLGAHSLHFNTVSVGICVIGDWTKTTPPSEQIKTTKALIAAGVELGFIKPNYKLIGHRQVRATSCPGDAFYENLKTWEHYSSFPASYKDLALVKELSSFVKDDFNTTKVL